MCRERCLYPHGLHRALRLQACQEEAVVQVLGVLQGQQRGLRWGFHRGPLAHPQVHGLGLRAWRVYTGPGAAWGHRESEVSQKVCLQVHGYSLISLLQAHVTQNDKTCLRGLFSLHPHHGPSK